MHPILAARGRLALYLTAWMAMAALCVSILALAGVVGWVEGAAVLGPVYFVYSFACLSTWYLCRAFPLGVARLSILVVALAAAPAALSALCVAILSAHAAFAARWFPGVDERLAHAGPALFGGGFFLALLAIALHYVVLAFEASREAEKREAVARLAARDAELRALKAQVNPHFLFNSLHSISALTSIDPAEARQMCILLADFLRLTLAVGDKTSIRLGEELALARNYLAVEKIRFRARLRVEEDLAPECDNFVVPPLLLQPLVENAVRHGVATLSEGAFVRISARCASGALRLVVENNFDPEAPPRRSGGLGLKNVRERLRARHGAQARLDAAPRGGVFRAALELPAETEEPSK
ncbi:MAG: histidine kinase [Bryobacterales bacterium]|nr:histidine kinase [Bryobacterales bacterium]